MKALLVLLVFLITKSNQLLTQNWCRSIPISLNYLCKPLNQRQRSKQIVSFFLLAFIACPSIHLAAQDDYKKFLALSYTELDSLMMVEYDKGTLDKAIPYMLAGKEKAEKEFGVQSTTYTNYLSWGGFINVQIGQYKQAELFFLESIAIHKKNSKEQHPDYANSLNSLADLYNNMGNYTKAEPLFFQAMAIWEKTLGEQHPYYAASLNNLALLYKRIENYTKAEPLYLQAIAINKKALGEQHPNYATSLNNLATLYSNMGNYTKAEPLYLQAIAIRKKAVGELHPDYATNLNNLALLYSDIGNYTKAEPLFLQAMTIRKKAGGELHPDYANSLNNLASLYQSMENYTKAEPLYLQTMAIYKKVLGEQHSNYATSLNNLSTLYQTVGKLDNAFYYCHLGILANAPTMKQDFSDWGNLDTFSYGSKSSINRSICSLLDIFQKQYDQSKDKNKLESHYALSQAAIRLNERFRKEFTTEGDKLRILAENNDFVLSAIKTGLELGKTDYEATTFGFAEMNKGVLLLEAAKTTNAQEFGGLPDSLAEQEKSLQKKQSSLSAKLLERRPEFEKDSLRMVLNDINQEIDIFTQILKNKYPKYAELKYGGKAANVKEIQALLDNQTALLEYVIGDSVVYIFYIDKNKIALVPQYIHAKDLGDKIKNFHAILSNYELAIKGGAISYQKYTENATWFYEKLVQPVLKNPKDISKLIIIPDGELGHLPFEAFLVKKASQKQTDYTKLHYLSNDYKISYNYSATLWKAAKETAKNKNNGQLLSMASNYNIKMAHSQLNWRLPYEQRLRDLLSPLPAARKEVEVLAETYNGFFALDTLASEKIFKEKAEAYAVIHLAMHGLLDDKGPILSSLAFSEDGDSLENNFLHAYEISKMKLNADLVVLSACETGYGRFDKGNGIASLAQAFSYAGAPALIVSLWQVNDFATSTIMKNLYHNLANGLEKDEALQQAKIQYMKEAKDVLAHPAFWSPFIMIGNTEAIHLEKQEGWFWWGIGMTVLTLLVAGLWRLQRKKSIA